MEQGGLAVNQVMLYINVFLALSFSMAGLTWAVFSARLQHEDDPNVSASLEKKRKNSIIATVMSLSIFSIINSIALFFNYVF